MHVRSILFASVLAVFTLTLAMSEPARGGGPAAVGDLYVTSPGTDEVLQLSGTTGDLVGSFVMAGAGGLDLPTGLAFGPNGNLFVLSQGTSAIGDDSILEFDGGTGVFVAVFHSGSNNVLWEENGSGEITWGSNGNLFASNWVNNVVMPNLSAAEFDGSDGSVVQIYRSTKIPDDGCVWRPHSLAIDGSSKVYLASRSRDIYAYNSATGLCESADVADPFASTGEQHDGIEFGPNGNLFASQRATNDVLEFDGTTGALVGTFVSAGAGGLDTPGDLKFGPNDNLFVVNVDGRILEYGADGLFVRVFSNMVIAGAQGDGQGRVHLAFNTVPEPASSVPALSLAGQGLLGLGLVALGARTVRRA